MGILLIVAISIPFTALAALVFSGLTLALGKLSPAFSVTGPEGWNFWQLYWRFLLVAAAFTFVTFAIMPIGFMAGFCAMILVYKWVFDAEWLAAVVIGAVGGTIAILLFAIVLIAVLTPLGLLDGK